MNRQTHRPISFGILLFAIVFAFLTFSKWAFAYQTTDTADILVWKNDDRLPGKINSANATRLEWQGGTLFRDPLDVDIRFLREIVFTQENSMETDEPFVVQTTDGNILFCDILKLNKTTLQITSKRTGDIEVNRTDVASIMRLEGNGKAITGAFQLDQWSADRGEMRYWSVDDQGRLNCSKKDATLYRKFESGDSTLIEIEFEWQDRLDFIAGFGVPRNRTNLDSLPRLETWEDSLVISTEDSFEIVYETIDQKTKRLKLIAFCDRANNKLVVLDEFGKQLAELEIDFSNAKIDPGMLFRNTGKDLTISSFAARSSGAGFDSTRPSVQTRQSDTVNGQVVSFDGSQWTMQLGDENEATVANSEFLGSFLMNPAKGKSPSTTTSGETHLHYADGMRLKGKLLAIENATATIQVDFADKPVASRLLGAINLKLDSEPQPSDESFTQVLVNDEGTIRGRLESGSGAANDVLRWRVPGAQSGAAFAHGDAKIVVRDLKSDEKSVASQYADTLILKNRDVIPANVLTMNELNVEVDSFIEKKQIPVDMLLAIDFGLEQADRDIALNPDEWFISDPRKSSRCFRSDFIKTAKDVSLGHLDLLKTGKMSFVVERPPQYGVLHCRLFDHSFTVPENDCSINLIFYNNSVSVAQTTDLNNITSGRPIKDDTVDVEFEYYQGMFVVRINGRQVYRQSMDLNGVRGRGVAFASIDLMQQGSQFELSHFKQLTPPERRHVFVDESRRDLLLTIPRLKIRDVPGHIVCATNSDLLRGNVLGVTKDSFQIRLNEEHRTFSRSLLSSIVWLHADELIAGLGDDERPSNEPIEQSTVVGNTVQQVEPPRTQTSTESETSSSQIVQVILSSGRQMTMSLSKWEGGVLIGDSELLGNCSIPFEEIIELRMGHFASAAKDVPYSDWVAHLAPEPKLEDASSPEVANRFGDDSPLIGKPAPNFTAKTIAGGEFELSKHKGKVVVLDFWATWCGPCISELPVIAKTVADYSEDDVVLIALNQEESPDAIRSFMEQREWSMNVGVDSGGIGFKYGVTSIPLTVIIGTDGKVAFVKTGKSADTESKLRLAIDGLLELNASNDAESTKMLNNNH
ncbi:MAG: TlpA disulfide reductase family protein [Pirellulaceae bacterium]